MRLNILGLFLLLTFAMGKCENQRPDLVPRKISFNSKNVLEVTFENQGKAKVPQGQCIVSIYINGEKEGSYDLNNLADQSFRKPGSRYTIKTNFKMDDEVRRIGFEVDAWEDVKELNEVQNELTQTVTPSYISGPDYIIKDLFLNKKDELRIKVQNWGHTPSPKDMKVSLKVLVNDKTKANFSHKLPSLPAGHTNVVKPPNPVTITNNSEVRALISTDSLHDEIDNRNNVREEIIPDGPPFHAYKVLLNRPHIADNLKWEGSKGVKKYPNWINKRKRDLKKAILRLEEGRPCQVSKPPALDGDQTISSSDAWAIFLAHVAQTLWVEKNRLVKWRLRGMTDKQLTYLLDGRKFVNYFPNKGRYEFNSSRMGSVTLWNPRICYRFLANFDLIKQDHLKTIYALSEWMRAHLVHSHGDANHSKIYNYSGMPPVDKVLYPLEGKSHFTDGCWGTTGLYHAILRTVNIPVEQKTVEYELGHHSRPYFMTVDKTMSHSDDLYTKLLRPSGEMIPISEIFYSASEMKKKFLDPAKDCKGSNNCNSKVEQAAYNARKAELSASWEHRGDYLMNEYSIYGVERVRNLLKGIERGETKMSYVKPIFPKKRREKIIKEIRARLQVLGNGDEDAGGRIVERRFERFEDNRSGE